MKSRIVAIVLLLLSLGEWQAQADVAVPDGYQVVHQQNEIAGVSISGLAGQNQSLYVAKLQPEAPVRLQDVKADQIPGDGLKPTSLGCRVVNCQVAVNADFFDPRSNAQTTRIAEKVSSLWAKIRSLSVCNQPLVSQMADQVGSQNALVKNGQLVAPVEGNPEFLKPNPRTLVGLTSDCELLIATADGRQQSRAGLTLVEAGQLMSRLANTTYVWNLDGGGSTTFVVKGQVVNRPSDTVVIRNGQRTVVTEAQPGDKVEGFEEREVSNVLAVVPLEPLPQPQASPPTPPTTVQVPAPVPPQPVAAVSPIQPKPAPLPLIPTASDREVPWSGRFAAGLILMVVSYAIWILRQNLLRPTGRFSLSSMFILTARQNFHKLVLNLALARIEC